MGKRKPLKQKYMFLSLDSVAKRSLPEEVDLLLHLFLSSSHFLSELTTFALTVALLYLCQN